MCAFFDEKNFIFSYEKKFFVYFRFGCQRIRIKIVRKYGTMKEEIMTVKTDNIKRKIFADIKKFRLAAAKFSQREGALYYAATLERNLCARAKNAAKNISAYPKITADNQGSISERLAASFIDKTDEMTEQKLCAFLTSTGEKYDSITLAVFPDILFAVIFERVTSLLCQGEEKNLSFLLRSAERIRYIDFSRIFIAFSATDEIFSREKNGVYTQCDVKTKFKYISELLYICRKEGVSEREKAESILEQANEKNVHIGTLIFTKNIMTARIYSLCLILMTLLISFIYLFLCELDIRAFVIFPAVAVGVYGTVKQILSLCFKNAGNDGLPRICGEKVKDEKAVVAIMSILCGPEKDDELFERLENFYLSDENPNRFYAIVCNLPDSAKRRDRLDEKTVSFAKARISSLNAKYGMHFGIFIRERRYSRSERKYIGWERKRGAVLELCRFMRGEKTSISQYIADKDFLYKTKYLITLDSDTNLYAGAADELIGTMLHSMNTPVIRDGRVVSGHAVVQPHIGAELESAAGTEFASITAGNGGIDSYASASFDIYENVFGNGSFCGKGILDIDVFLQLCDGFFPNERILSHDLLEGNLLGSAIASDITLTDSSPQTALSYYTRQHRWIRGDLQTFPYILGKVKNAFGNIIKNPMDTLGKYKIFDNIINAISPFTSLFALLFIGFTVSKYTFISFLFLFSYILFPIVYSFISSILLGNIKIAARRFRSRVMPHLIGTFAYSFYRICAIAHEAWIFADAFVRTVYRFAVIKRNFLNWKTAAAADRDKNDLRSYLFNMWFSVLCGAAAIASPSLLLKILGILWLVFPFLSHSISQKNTDVKDISTKQRDEICEYAVKMWNFFRDFVNESTNFLPPDNYEISPADRVAYRTSPTNIGLYLSSLLGARDLCLITSAELERCAAKTGETLEKMLTWRGHFYNWYDLKTLEILGEPFISTVDSGNFVCAVTAFCQGIKEYAFECPKLLDVLRVYENILKRVDFSALYDEGSRLFYIGYDVRKERYSESYYDTFMSEARMTSFYAAATGQVPREHFFAAARPIVTSGWYSGVASWSGTAFEYFMPALFMPVVPNSLSDEALQFAFRTEKKCSLKRIFGGVRRSVFGVSESGYWHFDSEMNYQYKAFGLSCLSLDPQGRNAPVISAYSTFLMLRYGVSECLDNLRTLKKLGAYGEYGFYEAVDFEKSRVGNGYGVVKSFMSHHVGMSFIAAVNILKNDIFVKRFMSMPKLRASRELLCEKIAVNMPAIPPKAKDKRNEKPVSVYRIKKEKTTTSERAEYSLLSPDVAMLSNNKMRVIASSSGHIAVYNGDDVLFLSDFDRYSLKEGLHVYAVVDGTVLPLVPLAQRQKNVHSEFDFYYDDCEIVYFSRHYGKDGITEIRLKIKVFADREIFSLSCSVSGSFRSAYAFVYGEPIIESEKAFLSHKSFANLFLQSKYEHDEETLIFSRRSKNAAQAQSFLGVRAYPDICGGAYDTKRDIILPLLYGESEISFIGKKTFSKTSGAMIIPALAMRTARADKKGLCGFIFAAASSEDDVRYMLAEREIRHSSVKISDIVALQYGASGISKETAKVENYILRSFFFSRGAKNHVYTKASKDIFWKRGISGENRMLLAVMKRAEKNEFRNLSLLIGVFKYMCIRGSRFDMIVIYPEKDLYNMTNKRRIENCVNKSGCRNFLFRENGIFPICENEFSQDELTLFHKICDAEADLSIPLSSICLKNSNCVPISENAEKYILKNTVRRIGAIDFVPPSDLVAENKNGYFTKSGFTVRKPHGNIPFSYVLAEKEFGTVITENSLGFTYFENSALGKITSHTADNMLEDDGEKILLRIYNDFDKKDFEDFDLAACAEEAVFEDGRAEYRGNTGGVKYVLRVGISEKYPIKHISVSITENKGKNNAELLFAVKPCLGERIERGGRYIFEMRDNFVFASSVFENALSCAIGVCAKKSTVYFDTAAMLSGGMVFSGNEDIACICVKPRESESDITFLLGAVTTDFSREDFMRECNIGFEKRKLYPLFDKVTIKTNDSLFDLSVNYLFPYQTLYSRFYARSGFYQVGGAYGFRDQLQDSLSFIEVAPTLCRDQILRCAAHQYIEGDVTHWWHEYAGRQSGLRSRYSDDLLWLPYAVAEYVEKTGEFDILYEKAPYLSSAVLDSREKERYEELCFSGEGTVYEHALKAAKLALERGFGDHSLLKFGGGDWNDGMNAVGKYGKGESVWLTEFCAVIYVEFSRICHKINDSENEKFFAENAKKLYNSAKSAFFDGWYLRGYYDNGEALGKRGNEECQIDSLSQSFAVFMDNAFGKDAGENEKNALQTVFDKLYDKKYGFFKLLSPPFDEGREKPGYIKGYLPGIRENGGQYTHAAVWACMALLLCGKTKEGIQALKSINPAVMSRDSFYSDRYMIEPYALAGDVYSHHECSGRGGWSFYTGAAAWYRKAVIEYVFGYVQRSDGFYIRPHMTEEFDGSELKIELNDTHYIIRFAFSERAGIVLDGKIFETEEEKMQNFFFVFDKGTHIVDYCMKKREE